MILELFSPQRMRLSSRNTAISNFVATLKTLLPKGERDLPILRGPLRGGVFHSTPRTSLRKIFGFYEHELNGWLAEILPRVDLVLDVGANDGYFTFGCAAAMRRAGKRVRIISFEPNSYHVRQLGLAQDAGGLSAETIRIVPFAVGKAKDTNTVALDDFNGIQDEGKAALIKIDVEGAELDVIAGARSWLKGHNYFLMEIHHRETLGRMKGIFENVGLALTQVNQQPLPIIGRESRDPNNWWLVTEIGGSRA